MRPDEIRRLTDEELDDQIRQTAEEISRLRFRKAYQELENPSLLGMLRKDLARMKTIRHERRTSGARDEASESEPAKSEA